MQTQTKQKTSGLRSFIAAGLMGFAGLAGIVENAQAQTNQVSQVKTSGNLAYFLAEDAKSGAQTTYPEINHSTTLPYGMKVSGFLDLYGHDKGYFGKTSFDKTLTERLSLRVQDIHVNAPLSQVGFGAIYSLPTPGKTFAKVSYLPLFLDSKGNQVDDKQMIAFVAGASLPYNCSALAFGEVNVAATKGPQWGYGEIELAKKINDRVSVGLNLQLNNKGQGQIAPEVIPRLAVRGTF